MLGPWHKLPHPAGRYDPLGARGIAVAALLVVSDLLGVKKIIGAKSLEIESCCTQLRPRIRERAMRSR